MSLNVAVYATDPVAYGWITTHLRVRPGVRVLAEDDHTRADVVLIMADAVTEETLACMRHVAETTVNGAMRIVLVTDHLPQEYLPRAVLHGLVGVVPRHDADQDRIVRAVLGSRTVPPAEVLGWLTGHIRELRQAA